MTDYTEPVVSGDTILADLKHGDRVAISGRRYKVRTSVDLGDYQRVDMESLSDEFPDGTLIGAPHAQVKNFPNVY